MTDKIPPAVQEAVQCIDSQIQHHLGLAQDLKSKRNALMPISRLPAEMLGRIFYEVRASYNGHRYYNDFRFSLREHLDETSLKWISVSHVSRHWRNVAIADASLWTDPPLANTQWTMMMLERSRMAIIPAMSLKVERLTQRVVAALMPHIPRVSFLLIPNMDRGTLTRVLSGIPSTAPNLEALSVGSFQKVTSGRNSWYEHTNISLYDEALVFPDNVLCHTPRLQHLELNDIIIKANSPLLSNLTTLSMTGLPERSKPTPQQFKTMLESTPCLKKLTLWGVCPLPESIQQKDRTAPVLMQHLEYLNIDENIPQLIYFFTIFSSTHLLKTVIVSIKWTEESAPDLPVLFALLDQPYLRSIIGPSTDVRRLEVGNDEGSFFVKASKLSISERNLEPHERQMAGHSARMTMWIDREWDGIDDEDSLIELTDILLSDLFNSLTWTGLYELDLTDLVCASPQLLASTFGTVLGARIIMSASYDNERLPLLIEALNHRPDTQSDGLGSMPPSFPGLQHMDLRYTTFIQGEERLEVLLKCLQQRHDCGIPLISLKFDHDLLEEQIVLKLKKYVKHIILTPLGSEHKVVDDYSPYKHTWYL